jgi:phage tail-like protein
VTLVNPVANNNFSVFLFDAEPLDTSPGGLVSAGAGLALGVAKTVVFGSFSEVSGLDAGIEPEEYREGGFNAAPRVFPSWGKYSKVVLKRGTTPDPALWDWYYQVLRGDKDVLRKNGLIVLTDKGAGLSAAAGGPTPLGLPVVDKLPIAVWYLERGLPERLQGPSLSGTGNEIAVESLEIAHEGLIRVGAAMIPGLGDSLAKLGL